VARRVGAIEWGAGAEERVVFPIGDDNSTRLSKPVLTVLLILANVGVFLLELAQGDALQGFVERWSVIPKEYTERADFPPTIPFPFWFTTLSAMFMHGGWMHLGGNMLFLWIFGDNLEDVMGRARYLVFYLLCGIGATAAQILVDPRSTIPNLGASGAISGVLAGYVVLFPRRRVRVLLFRAITQVPAFVAIGIWVLMQLIGGIGQVADTRQTGEGGVAYAAHVGGFVAGLVLVFVLRRRGRMAPSSV
jgi:membrane associated rhomboid family serine protease